MPGLARAADTSADDEDVVVSDADRHALDAIQTAFRPCPRPEHFTDYEHCEECAEHDELLRARDLETLSIQDVGNPGWDPICFVSSPGFLYYLPALARLCLEEATYGYGWYGNLFFWHLISNGPRNERFAACTPEQQQAVVKFIEYVVVSRAALIDEHLAADDAAKALSIWSGEAVP